MKDKRIFITGGTSGIGKSLLQRLQKDNSVMVCGRNQSKIDQTKSIYEATDVLQADISKEDDLTRIEEAIQDKYDGLDVLINNAGIAQFTPPNEGFGSNHFEEMIVNFHSTLMLTHRLKPLLLKSHPKPTVVFVSSILAKVPNYDLSIYSASKAALHSYAVSFRKKHPEFQITEVFPPLVDTPMTEGIDDTKMDPDVVADKIIRGAERGRKEIYPGIASVANQLNRWWPAAIQKMINK